MADIPSESARNPPYCISFDSERRVLSPESKIEHQNPFVITWYRILKKFLVSYRNFTFNEKRKCSDRILNINIITNPKFDLKNEETLDQDKNARQWVGENINLFKLFSSPKLFFKTLNLVCKIAKAYKASFFVKPIS